jgi:hypothetical protein
MKKVYDKFFINGQSCNSNVEWNLSYLSVQSVPPKVSFLAPLEAYPAGRIFICLKFHALL